MQYFLLLLSTVSIAIVANPIQTISDDSSLILDDVSDPVIGQDSISSTVPGCAPSTSMNGESDGGIQKRFQEKKVCPIETPKIQGQPPSAEPHKSINEENPCADPAPKYVTCGGTEFYDPDQPRKWFISIVMNCDHAKRTSLPERGLFAATDVVADYCCHDFDHTPPLYNAYSCVSLTPDIHQPRATLSDEAYIRVLDQLKIDFQKRRGNRN